MSSRPNFVIFMPDQLRADAVGAFGNPHVSTPHIDALAAGGTRFTNAFVQHPVCSPSRASILTGWYPHTAGHRTLTHLLKEHEPNLLRILKDSGYHVAWAGYRGDTFAPGVTEASAHEYGFATPPNVFQEKDYPDGVWSRLFYRGEVSGEGRIDHDEAATRSAERWLADPPEQPWVLFVPMVAPHCPFQAEEPWFSQCDRDEMPDPTPPGDPAREPRYMAAIRERYGLGEVTPEQWREVKATYYGMIARLDDQLGRVMSAVSAAGAADDTVTLFFADHGEYLGDHGLIEKWPSAMHDSITRDPLIISGAGFAGGGVCDSMVEMIDVLPTILELAGAEAPHRHFGRSLTPLLADPSAEHRRYAFTEGGFTVEEEPQLERPSFPYDRKGDLQHEDPTLVGKAVAVRDREWTYVWRLYEAPELYHRASDPGERVNLAGLGEHAEVEQRLRDALLRWMVETADVIPADPDPRLPRVDLPGTGTR
ncbi:MULTISPECIES: sulfatase-like hydrolase/transferase [unclassified Streptomyces]|uniref:sulfatase-like hydrolase/transferase n=1 Tax=unclassified Streptomyces TaxID=2593676 RepID=UPI0016605AEA|nr:MULTISPECIES: sulfatase-like hydrolase/transferase [unclassified Streptomyces]MBD0709451.1 sulfatase [Streptomyces sp. CBMA291]MBD0713161.1 sulfatase [Streptomyces sp. CBMA370]